ncbi:MAG TPA: flagellar motor protein MotB [Lacipirellulaceae bacterium]|nr:flagellar motor protein MotB [Lacipirellulaceae bacterium]
MAGKGGGAWKVAYADFVTAMMAFFMVMWLTSQKPEVKQAVAGYFRDPYAIYKGNESGSASDAAPVEDPKLGHAVQSQRRRVSNSGNDSNYQFAVPFSTDDAALDPAARELVRSFAPTMVGKLNRVEVRAHCQRSPLPADSPFKDRWDLCYARGRSVQEALVAEGIEADRIRLSQAEANEPMAANLTPEELKLNSRVDVILLDDVIATPWQQPPTEERLAAPPPGAQIDLKRDDHGEDPPPSEEAQGDSAVVAPHAQEHAAESEPPAEASH